MYARRWSCAAVSLLALVELAGGGVEIVGEISFDLKVPEQRARADKSVTPGSINMTQAAPVECVYQYPETPQVDAMLSNMMNQLTKMFVRVNKYLRSSDSWREDKRFKVVQDSSSSDFFDTIFFNMTEEYRRFVNHTRSRVAGVARGDPCDHQSEIRDVWRALLDSSREAVRRAALAYVEEYLRVSARSEGDGGEGGDGRRGRARSLASQLLRRELARLRTEQLTLLCDNFQLCFDDLL